MLDVARIEADQLEPLARAWDEAVDRSDGADEFCAATVWSFSAASSFPEVEPPVVLTDGRSFAGMRSQLAEDGTRLLVGLDPIWGFATPAVGHPLVAARLLDARLRLDDHDLAVVAGQREYGYLLHCLVQVTGERARLLKGPAEQRLQADLGGGVPAWWARRSPRFRQRMRQIRDRAEAEGVAVVDCSALPPDEAMDRILAIEARSWKGREGTGLAQPDLAEFYRRMAWRLAAADQLRLLVARRAGQDVGYILGGVRARTYRGLQLAYTDDVSALGLGHLLQLHQVEGLQGSGVHTYDMGMDMAYKRRWADRVDETFSVLVVT